MEVTADLCKDMLYTMKLRIYDYDFEKEKLEPIYVGEEIEKIKNLASLK